MTTTGTSSPTRITTRNSIRPGIAAELTAAVLLAALLLCGCGRAQPAPELPSQVSQAGEAAAEAASGTVTDGQNLPLPPTVTPALLIFPDGSQHSADTEELDLSWLCHEDVAETAELLRRMKPVTGENGLPGWTGLRKIDLGSDGMWNVEAGDPAAEAADSAAADKPTAETPSAAGGETPGTDRDPVRRDLTWEDIRILQDAAPQADILYRFTLFGKALSTGDEVLDFSHVEMDDEGEAVREILSFMKKCKRLDMDFCGVSSERMQEIRDAYPEIEVVWRIWFGTDCSVRTDVERILASNLNHKLTDDNTQDLKYCTKVRFLDIGHNEHLHDFSFLEEMPELEVAVLCITGMRDLAPLANHKKLEYLEINTLREGMDLTPLGSCENLQHLNICCLGHVQGWSALKNLKKLQRLWLGDSTYLPPGGLEELQKALPDTVINTTNPYGSNGDWRYDGSYNNERYELLRQQFEYDNYANVCSSWYNDPLYYREGEERTAPNQNGW